MIQPPKIILIRSDIAQLKLVETFLLEIFQEYNLDQKNFNKVFLCISEAVVNAIEHGNGNDSNKMVFVGIDVNEDLMDIYVKDEGKGFNIENIQDPTAIPNIKKESGRGIHIIKSLSNGILFNNKGNFVQIKVKCE